MSSAMCYGSPVNLAVFLFFFVPVAAVVAFVYCALKALQSIMEPDGPDDQDSAD